MYMSPYISRRKVSLYAYVEVMECAIGGAIAPPDFNLVGKQYIMPHQIFKQNCQFILNMFLIYLNFIK